MKNKKKKSLWYLCAGISNGRSPKAEVEGLLISAASDCKNPRSIQQTKEMMSHVSPKHRMTDSGGFQILTADKKGITMTFDPERPLSITKKCFNLAPLHVDEKAMEMKADSMVALDFPIRKIKDHDEREREFRQKLPQNVTWAIETARLRKDLCPDISLFIPVQAYDLRQFEEFYGRIYGIDFDGFSLPVRNMSMKDIAAFLLKIHKWGIKKVHILGSSSLPTISVCAYMSQGFFDWVSFDATTWRVSAQYGTFIHPYDLSSKKLHKVGSYDPHYCCYCKSCEGRTLGQLASMDRKERMAILMTHNYLAIRNLSREFGEAVVDSQYLEKRLKRSKRRDIKRILRCMSEIETMCSMSYGKAA